VSLTPGTPAGLTIGSPETFTFGPSFRVLTADANMPLVVGGPTTLGPKGDTGLTGPTGPAGAPYAGFLHTQATPAATWVVTHNLNRRPTVVVILTGSTEQVWPDVSYPDRMTVSLEFPTPSTGIAEM
jgi:hypothetical protein